MKEKRAQVAIEYLMLIGMFFFALIIIFYFTTSESSKSVQINEADSAVNSLAKTADYLYALGPGSRDIVEIKVPGNINKIEIEKRMILINLETSAGATDIFAETKANVTGTISSTKGTKHIKLEVLDNGVIQIME